MGPNPKPIKELGSLKICIALNCLNEIAEVYVYLTAWIATVDRTG